MSKRCVWVVEGKSTRSKNWQIVRLARPGEQRRRSVITSVTGWNYRVTKYVPEKP